MDFNDYPSPQGLNWRPIALIGGGVLIVLVAIGVVARLTDPSNSVALQQLVDKQVTTIKTTCADMPDPEACEAGKILNSVELSGQAALCEELAQGQQRDDCFFLVAQSESDTTLCKQIEQAATKTLCLDTVYRDLADIDITYCDKLSTQAKSDGCRRTLNPLTLEECQSSKSASSECQFLSISTQAQQQQDANICDRLETQDAENCRELVLTDDPDYDGLSTDRERNKYGTDPYNSDTDGDGYSDGDEVKSGYNPNGEGPLE